jgi:CubicO group peptidase (beta-lactamase class C family)
MSQRTFIRLLTLAALAVPSATLHAQEPPWARALDSLFAPWNRLDSPGAALAVVEGGHVVYAKGYGAAHLEYDIPITPSTVFHVASVSKQFTAFALVLLAAEGRLSLDDDVRTYVPELADFGHRITIRQLAHHTSGLRDQWNLLALAGWRLDDVITREHILKLVERQRELNFPPGAEYLYSNTGYTLMAEIVTRVTGRPFPEWMQDNVFRPLGMASTLFYDDHERIVRNRAYSYRADGPGFKKSVLSYANVGATSLFTTVEDMARWVANFGNPTVGDRTAIETLTQRGVLASGDTISYALGIAVDRYRGHTRMGHSGGDAGYRTYVGYFPDFDVGVIVFSNLASFDPFGLSMRTADIVLRGRLADEPDRPVTEKSRTAALPPDRLRALEGHYRAVPSGSYVRLVVDNGRLIFDRDGRSTNPVAALPDGRLVLLDLPEEITLSEMPVETGKPKRLAVHRNGRVDGHLEAYRPWEPTAEERAELLGDYFSAELATTYTMAEKDGRLILRHTRHADIELTPRARNHFTSAAWFMASLAVERDAGGRATGFRVSSGRVRNLLFRRQP